ncbi:ParA family protein [Mameliella sediminis]|uniref:ParA family protein n=1 Tax=Mameliella sediminis TaxID=2836866 RepID=UPI001C45EEAF|nr:AAA family ATPase [Mameliella sediminis]MBY6114782.1 AAA family ATPase [Antarctobacter heliothermus]MBY6144355.1 AAA family ATPase [Mameliella alba]MBV7392737.1 AAA family ATPase [Mameliella sediminis]MBY6161354.1 AAA family ATPase [Mameliella alba]MBY6170180.1 AAA family ATPase [Mameliella alba]
MKIIACYSNKGGVGKTATSVNFSHALASSGQRVLLCDLDPQGASGFYFRVKPSKKLKEAAFFEDVQRFTRSIRASDYDGLDILPANMTFRDFDIFLSRMKNPRTRLKKALKAVNSDYDVIVLDCPPNVSTLSENVFRASDAILVPVIPTTLSERTFEQLIDLFREHKLDRKKILGFFSMAQGTKRLHTDTIERMRDTHAKRFLETVVPFSSEVEKMGLHRAPVTTYAGRHTAGKAYEALSQEVLGRF